jgi:hypothetical protein
VPPDQHAADEPVATAQVDDRRAVTDLERIEEGTVDLLIGVMVRHLPPWPRAAGVARGRRRSHAEGIGLLVHVFHGRNDALSRRNRAR